MHKNISNKRIWITGASSGIGFALATELARQNNQIIISGRNEEGLNKLMRAYPERIVKLKLDVTHRDEVLAAGQFIQNLWGSLDIVILNAGISDFISVKNFDSRLFERIHRVNVLGVAFCVEAALPLLRKGKDPYLLAVASAAAYMGLPTGEAYGSSKAAVRYLMQSLRADLYPEKIDVSVICPGFIDTPMTKKNNFPMPFLMSAPTAAHMIVQGMKKRKAEIHFPKIFTYVAKGCALLPDFILVRLSQFLLPK